MSRRRFLLLPAAAAGAILLLQGLTGLEQLALYAAPLLLIVGLLLGGRFVGEERILARCRAPRRRPARPLAVRWDRAREVALASPVAWISDPHRGPPAALAAA
jgi:hypothetical protein